MAKPKRIEIHPEYSDRSGICIEYIKFRKTLNILGWYDSCVGIEGREILLKDFCEQLGITKKDLK